MQFKVRKQRIKAKAAGPTHMGAILFGSFVLIMFSLLCVLSLFYNGKLSFFFSRSLDADQYRRKLLDDELVDDCYPEAYSSISACILPFLGILYIFIALAVVCDEFFVPALDVISEKMEITPDIAGATLMAAGGSAPELFTNVFATFNESDAGFGTIIGSAVFNVLFVIGMCAMFSKDSLSLTWWPLARDCICYTIGLCVLAIFIGGPWSENQIGIGEAIVLFLMYFIYIAIMTVNLKLHKWVYKIRGKVFYGASGSEYSDDSCDDEILLTKSSDGLLRKHSSLKDRPTTFLRAPSTFRCGFQQMMLGNENDWKYRVSKTAVLQITGDAEATFKKLDTQNRGKLSKENFGKLLKGLNLSLDEKQDLIDGLDTNRDDEVDYEEFLVWYVSSENRIKRDLKDLFEKYDHDSSGSLEKNEFVAFLWETGKMNQSEIDDTIKQLFPKESDNTGITQDDFFVWLDASELLVKEKELASSQSKSLQGFRGLLKWPKGCFQRFWYVITFPLMVVFTFTMVDVKVTRKHSGRWAVYTFMASIAYIGLCAKFMVDWAIGLGDTAKIPNYIMGMTFLAAGTSIPDLLSSVIVARQGFGDMAVSSSIGSNIFDILVGLPLPWIFFIAIKGKSVNILSCDLALSIVILNVMLIAVVTSIKCSNWKMSKNLGFAMFGLYIVFLVQDLVRNFSGDPCESSCD